MKERKKKKTLFYRHLKPHCTSRCLKLAASPLALGGATAWPGARLQHPGTRGSGPCYLATPAGGAAELVKPRPSRKVSAESRAAGQAAQEKEESPE